ncbi:MAG: plasmid pRiA4b ORF-3 family protein [Hyphomicrobium sp.]
MKLERIAAPDPGASYPRLVEAIGRCPPEDIGGAPGYEEFLAAIADPNHERHAEITEWYDADFDPESVDTAAIKRELAALAKRWSRPTSALRRKTS